MKPTQSESPSSRILVVEDDAASAYMLGKFLRGCGYEVEVARGTVEAAALDDRTPFDVLVSDLTLPDGDGFSLMRTLRGRHALCGVSVSGYDSKEDVEASSAAGFSKHLGKPFELDELETAVRTLVSHLATPFC